MMSRRNSSVLLDSLLVRSNVTMSFLLSGKKGRKCTVRDEFPNFIFFIFFQFSHHRLWSLQVLVTIIPILLFSFIATQVQAKHKLYSAYVSSFEEKQSKSSTASKSASMLSSDHDRFIYAQAKNKLSHYEVKTVNHHKTFSFLFFLSEAKSRWRRRRNHLAPGCQKIIHSHQVRFFHQNPSY